MSKTATPLAANKLYWDYRNWYLDSPSVNLFYNNPSSKANEFAKNIKDGSLNEDFFVFLPIPKMLIQPFLKSLEKDQNVRLVNNRNEAEYELLLNYSIKREDNNSAAIIFFFHKFNEEKNAPGIFFNKNNVSLAKVSFDTKATTSLAANLNELCTKMIRKNTRQWLNID